MPAVLGLADLSTFAGSWPVVPGVGPGGELTVLPRTLNTKATILGVFRETDTGFDVRGRSFRIYVDDEVTYDTVSFAAGAGNLTLAEVITQINTDVGAVVAKRDNGFLRLESTTSGTGSYLRLTVDPASSPTNVLFNLGLFSETISLGGEVSQTQNIDPGRQIALPGQKTLAEGENIEARVVNRALFQLAVNSDINSGVVFRKRVPSVKELDLGSLSSDDGFSLSAELMYTGPFGPTAEAPFDHYPSEDELEGIVKILDDDGRELVWKGAEVQDTDSAPPTISQNAETGEWVVLTNDSIWLATDPKNNIFIRMSGLSANSAINGVPLKVVNRIDAMTVVFDPAEHESTMAAESGVGTAERVSITLNKLRIKQIQKSDVDTTRVEQLQAVVVTGVTVTRVEKNNRIVCEGATFDTSQPLIWWGHLVEWSNHGITIPYTNDGIYRILRVLDKETLEVAAEDWGPAYLNSNLTGGTSEIEIRTDGSYWKGPYFKFPDGVDVIGRAAKLRFYAPSTLNSAMDNPYYMIGNDLDYGAKGDLTVQQAIIGIIGPSAGSIDEYLYDDRRVSLEGLNSRLVDEHYGHDTVGPDGELGHGGRHSAIRPDNIDLFPYNGGPTVTVRSTTGDETERKIRLTSDDGATPYFSVYGNGIIWSVERIVSSGIGVNLSNQGTPSYGFDLPPEAVSIGTDEKIISEMDVSVLGTITKIAAPVSPGSLPTGTWYYRVSGVDINGNIGLPSNQESVDVTLTDVPLLSWFNIPGAASYCIWRYGTYGYWEKILRPLGVNTFEDYNNQSATTVDPPTESQAWATQFGGTSWIGGHLSVNRAPDEGAFNVQADHGEDVVMTLRKYYSSDDVEGYDGIYSPGVFSTMEGGDNILRTDYKRWDGSAWVLHHAVSHERDYIKTLNGLEDEVEQSYITNNGVVYSGTYSGVGPNVNLYKGTFGYGDWLKLVNAWGNVNIGSESSNHNFYIQSSITPVIPFLTDLGTGRVAIGRGITDFIGSSLEVYAVPGIRSLDIHGVYTSPTHAALRVYYQLGMPTSPEGGDITCQQDSTGAGAQAGLFYHNNNGWSRLDNAKLIAASALETWGPGLADYTQGFVLADFNKSGDLIANAITFNQDKDNNYGVIVGTANTSVGAGYTSQAANEWTDLISRVSGAGSGMGVAYGNNTWVACGQYEGTGYEGWVQRRVAADPNGAWATMISGSTQKYLCITYCPNGGVNCFIIGGSSGTQARWWKSTDGGATFPTIVTGDSGYSVNKITNSNTSRLISVCNGGRYYVSSNNGASWSSYQLANTEDLVGAEYDGWSEAVRWVICNAAGDVLSVSLAGDASSMFTGTTLMGSVGINDIAVGEVEGLPVYCMVGGWDAVECHIWYSFNLKEWIYVPRNRWMCGLRAKTVEWRIDHFVVAGTQHGSNTPFLVECRPIGRSMPSSEL